MGFDVWIRNEPPAMTPLGRIAFSLSIALPSSTWIRGTDRKLKDAYKWESFWPIRVKQNGGGSFDSQTRTVQPNWTSNESIVRFFFVNRNCNSIKSTSIFAGNFGNTGTPHKYLFYTTALLPFLILILIWQYCNVFVFYLLHKTYRAEYKFSILTKVF